MRELLAPTYAIDRELGLGGMATVCLAQDTKHERVVALKVLHPGLAESVGLSARSKSSRVSIIRTFFRSSIPAKSRDFFTTRRADLVPNRVSTVKGYAAHERETLDAVTQARTKAVAAQGASLAQRAQAEGELTNALRGLVITAEAYPQLQASGGFRDLQAQLATIEDAVQNSRRYYNAVVRDFNTAISTVPSNVVAGPMGYKELE